MADIEKVIKGLTHCLARYVDGLCDDCPYMGALDKSYMIPMKCKEIIMRDALELLKEYAVIKETISNEIHETAKMFRRTEDNGWIERCDRRARQSLSD